MARLCCLVFGATLLLSWLGSAVSEADEAESGTCASDSTDPACKSKSEGAPVPEEAPWDPVAAKLTDEGNALANKGEYLEAIEKYTQALAIDNSSIHASNPMVNIGLTMKYIGSHDEAIRLLKAGVKLNPSSFHAVYNLANELALKKEWLEADGMFKSLQPIAVVQEFMLALAYARFLQISYHHEDGREAFEGRDVFAESYPHLQRALVLVKQYSEPEANKVSLLAMLLIKCGKLQERKDLAKWAVTKDIFKDYRQRPLNFNKEFASRFTAVPWWKWSDTYEMPDFLEEVGEKWKVYRKELDALLKSGQLKGVDDEDFEYIDQSKGHDWRQLQLFAKGIKDANNSKLAPKTTKIFRETPVAGDIEGGVSFSVLMPGTRTFPRCGLTNVRLTCHLGLRIPNVAAEKVGISVAEEKRAWKEGTWACFDDSFEVGMWNDSEEPAGIISIQFTHPAWKQTQR